MGVSTKERKGVTAEVLRYSWPLPALSHWEVKVGGTAWRRCGAQALLEVRRRFLVGNGRPSMLMLGRSAEALATMRPVLLLRVLKNAARR